MLKAETITHTNYVGNTLKKKVELLISGIIVKGPIKRVLLKIVRQYNVRETKEVTHLFGRAKFKNSFYLKSDFSTPIRAPFEKVTLNIPNGVDNYLRQRYGDRYMDIPDEKTKAIYSSHALRWSVE